MSASIYWKQERPGGQPLMYTSCPSRFMEILTNANMELPYTFTEEHCDKLAGMAAAWGDQDKNPFKELWDKVIDLKAVTVWAVY